MLLGSTLLAAQQPVAPRDTTARPPAAPRPATDTSKAAATRIVRDTTKVDSATARRRRLAADTVKAPLARSELPVEVGGRWHWSGEALKAAGALTLADLLQRIPGATSFRANWIPAPQFIAWNGDAGRVRVFRDGVEMDAIDPRNGGVLDLATVALWPFEEVSVERGPGELRVHLRSWRVDKTIPVTQTDITTGSENTNLYRGYFGKRMHNGGAIQVAAQQYNTISPRSGGDGSSLQFFTRLGWAWKQLSVDGVWQRASMDRAATRRFDILRDPKFELGVPAFKGGLGNAYGRVAWGDPDAPAAPWMQLIASTQSTKDGTDTTRVDTLTTIQKEPSGKVDTVTSYVARTFAVSRVQYVLAAGASHWGLRASATARLRVGEGRKDLSPALRLGYDWRFVSLAAFAESRGQDSTSRAEVTGRIAPWNWLVLTGAYGSYTPKSPVTGGPAFTASRADVSTTLFGVTLTGGVLSRDLTTLAAPVALDSTLVRTGTGPVMGLVAGVRGRVYRDLGVDISGVRWESSGAYRPQMDVHSSLILDSGFPGRFPRNNFHMLASLTWDHRTPMFFPNDSGGVGKMTGPIDALGARLEIRIESGTVFFQAENMVGKAYDSAPGYLMPRRLQIYGLRWEFWN